jgi:DNA polymerase III subunit delta'
MNILKFNWQEKDWRRLQTNRARLPHALLIHGAPDIGKREFAEHLAKSLLCENPAEHGHPCGACPACGWFAERNHPDFRAVLPEILQPEEPGAEGEGEVAVEKTSKTKTPSKEIKIEQIRRLDSFFNTGTHRGGARVVLVYPADALNVPSSNALLKTLEEPAPGTVFLLVTSHPDQVLPTIRSRAAKFMLSGPDAATSIAWLEGQGVDRAEQRLAEAGGAPLAALRASTEDIHSAERDTLIDALANAGAPLDPLALAEKVDKAGNENLVLWLMRWVADLLYVRQTGGAARYYPGRAKAVVSSAAAFDVAALHRYYRKLVEARRMAGHPLNPRLFAEELLIDYARLTRSIGRV